MASSSHIPEPPAAARKQVAAQRCIDPGCGASYPVCEVRVACEACGGLLDVVYDWDEAWPEASRSFDRFEQRSATRGPRTTAGTGPATEAALDFSGVWRFRELLPFWKLAPQGEADIVTVGEGRTNLQRADTLAKKIGIDATRGGLYLQYEGFNPSGSFKDNGMCAAFTHARMVGARRVACASTGNTSASLAMYASLTGMPAYVFVGDGKIAYGKLSQALDFGAVTLRVAGDFDACLRRVREIASDRPELGVYLMNSVNPFRLEGQKTIMLRVLEGLDWRVPDWIVVPGGNLGNTAAFGKAFMELRALGLIDRVPRLAVINAAGASTLERMHNALGVRWKEGRYDRAAVRGELERMRSAGESAHTVASAIEINHPVNLPKALRSLDFTRGVVRTVDDRCIVEHKALVGRHGFGCEPASGASVAGARRLIEEGVITPSDTVVCILTGHALKDPDVTVGYHTGGGPKPGGLSPDGEPDGISIAIGASANRPVPVADDLDAIARAIEGS